MNSVTSVVSSLFTVWRPLVPESNDGKPLVSNHVSELVYHFPYERLPNATVLDQMVSIFMRPECVVLFLVLYLLSKKPTVYLRDHILKLQPNNVTFTNMVAVHNFLLAVFSGVCAYNAWLIVFKHYYEHGFYSTYCELQDHNSGAVNTPFGNSSSSSSASSVTVHSSLWSTGFGSWTTLFYLSKYWEFVDTWILILKHKSPSLLQVYHHTGIVITMWMSVCSQSSWILFAVMMNSVIHTIMYTYFFLKTLYPQMTVKYIKYLTMAQISQFLMGIFCTTKIFFLRNDCVNNTSFFTLICSHLYGYGLIALFMSFANQKYNISIKKQKVV